MSDLSQNDVTGHLDARIDELESQNQALQREVENKAAVLNAIEALLDVDDEHTGWDRIVALQERAEKAEEAIRNYFRENGAYVASDGEWATAVGYDSMLREHLESLGEEVPKHAAAALSPTQETGYVPSCFPFSGATQETDPE